MPSDYRVSELLKEGLLVQVTYENNGVQKRTGRIKVITPALVILTTDEGYEIPIPFGQIRKVERVDKTPDAVESILDLTFVTAVLLSLAAIVAVFVGPASIGD